MKRPRSLWCWLLQMIVCVIFMTVQASAQTSMNQSGSVKLLTNRSGSGGSSIVDGSGTIAVHGTFGSAFGESILTAASTVMKTGFIGQLYDYTELSLVASPTTINEGGSRQIEAMALLDDGTKVMLDSSQVVWSIAGGPLAGIDPSGLAMAAFVYTNTLATVKGSFQSFSDEIGLTVLNVNPDDFGSYANDGLDDDWQVDHFGFDNPLAGPDIDADGDEQDNAFEALAKLDPTDPRSFFNVWLRNVPGEPNRQDISFFPVFPDRNYKVYYKWDLRHAEWLALAGSESTHGDERTVVDENAGNRKFYQVEISE